MVGAQVALHNPSYTASELAHQFRLVRTSAILSSAKAFKKCCEAAQKAVAESEQGFARLKGDSPKVWVFDEPSGLQGSGASSSDSSSKLSATQAAELNTASWFHIIQSGQSLITKQQDALTTLWQWHRDNVSPDDDAIYCFSSGTSGRPKAVRLLHRNLVANTIQATALMRDRTLLPLFDRWDPQKDESSWYNEPLQKHPEVKVTDDGQEEEASESLLDKIKTKLHLGPRPLPPVEESSRELHIDLLPQFHCYGLVVAFVALHTATPRYVLPRFSLLLFLELVTKHKVTFAFVVPPILLALSRSPEVDSLSRGFDLSSLTRLASGAASLPPGLRKELWEKRKINVTDGYGMTEMSPIICLQMVRDLDWKAAEGSVGQLSPNTEARVVDDQGNDVPTGQVGELLLRGPQRMAGYLRNDEANEESFVHAASSPKGEEESGTSDDDDIWLKTGDVVSINTEGFVRITDRTKDVIKVSGFQVSPAELEDELLKNPLVHDVAVVGVQDPGTSNGEEVPWAFCVASDRGKKEEADDESRAKRVKEELNQGGRIAKYKFVKGVTWLDALPKSDSGKVLKKDLKKQRSDAADKKKS